MSCISSSRARCFENVRVSYGRSPRARGRSCPRRAAADRFRRAGGAVADMLSPKPTTSRNLPTYGAVERWPSVISSSRPGLSTVRTGSEPLQQVHCRASRPLSTSLQAGALRLHVPEGYAYYGLYPETYVAAATSVPERPQSPVRPSASACAASAPACRRSSALRWRQKAGGLFL